MTAEILFWATMLFVFYTYMGYPVLLYAWSRIFPKPVAKSLPMVLPPVSVVIAARNEAGQIEARIRNLLLQAYPADRFEIIVVSDGSTDETASIVERLAADRPHPAITLVRLDRRRGKPDAVNRGVECARGDILVFADARQRFEPDVLRQLVANFSDPRVGCVSGELFLGAVGGGSSGTGINLYWRLEKMIRKTESATGSMVGATGAIYAVRKDLYRQMPSQTLIDDVWVPMRIVCRGFRSVFDSEARAHDEVSKDTRQEMRRKIRTLAGNWQLIQLMPEIFLPGRNPIWWRFMSHKVFRLAVPFVLPVLLVSGVLAEGGIYSAAVWAQLAFYGLAAAGFVFASAGSFRLVRLCSFFLAMNAAVLTGFWYWISGRSGDAWKRN